MMQIRPVVSEKNAKTYTLIPKNDVTKAKARLYSNINRLKINFKLVSENLKLTLTYNSFLTGY